MRPTSASNQIPALKWTIIVLRFFGAYEKKQTIRGYIAIASLSFLTFEIFFDGVINWDGVKSLRKVVYLPSVFLCTLKGVYLLRKSKQLMHLIGMLGHFWRADAFDEKTTKKVNKVFVLLTRIMQGYIAFIVLFCIGIIPLPALDAEHKTLIFTDFSFCNMQQSFACWISNYVYQCVFLICHGLPAGVGFDLVFIISTGYIYNACQLLQAGLKRLNTDDKLRRKYMLQKIVAQHDYLLDFVHNLNELCTMVMFTQFSLTLWSLILCLYMIVANGIPPSFEDATYFSLLYMIFSNQLFLYASSGSIIEEQLRNLSMSIFMVDWYDKGRTDMRKDLSLMIQRAQNSKILSAGKLSDLNLALFLATMKQAMSVFTLIWQISTASSENHKSISI